MDQRHNVLDVSKERTVLLAQAKHKRGRRKVPFCTKSHPGGGRRDVVRYIAVSQINKKI